MNDGFKGYPDLSISPSAWRVDKQGNVFNSGTLNVGGGVTGSNFYTPGGGLYSTTATVYVGSNSQLIYTLAGSNYYTLNTSAFYPGVAGLTLGDATHSWGQIWLNAGNTLAAGGSVISSDGPNIISFRNSTGAQVLNIYNTYANTGNYERGYIKWQTGVGFIVGNASGFYGGTGVTNRNMEIAAAGNLNIVSNNNITGIILSGSSICFYGNTSGLAPSTSTLTVPVTIPTYGRIDKICGNPDGFMEFLLSGRLVKVPYFY